MQIAAGKFLLIELDRARPRERPDRKQRLPFGSLPSHQTISSGSQTEMHCDIHLAAEMLRTCIGVSRCLVRGTSIFGKTASFVRTVMATSLLCVQY